MNIWISTDLHLFTQDNDERHPFRSRHNLGQLSDQLATGISSEDLWIFLGDLCDPNVSDQTIVRQVVQSIPCRKFMCRGNHDQQDDTYYKELGFEVVAEVIRYHNILFSHKPLRVAPDEVNIHGHLHTEQMSGLGPNHINAYASNWNDNDHPVLLEDLIASATVQDVTISKSDEDHINSKFEKYTSLENDHYSNFYELVDDESVTEAVIISDKDLQHNVDKWGLKNGQHNVLYITGFSGSGKSTLAEQMERDYNANLVELDGIEWCYDASSSKLIERTAKTFPAYNKIYQEVQKTGKPYDWTNDEVQKILYPMVKKVIAAAESEKDTLYIVEGLQLYELYDGSHFKGKSIIAKGTSFLKSRIRAYRRDKPSITTWIKQIASNWPDEKTLSDFKKGINESIGDIPCGYKPGYISSWQKDTDTVMDEILFQDAEETKYWMSDNDEYPKKKDQADQNKQDTSVVLDETVTHSKPKVTAKISKTKNPNDGVSSTAVRLWFFNERKEEIGEASASAIDTNTAFLYDVEVFPAYRGKGYGYAIVEYMMDHYPITELTVEKSNKVAISLYKKFGFTETMEFKENGKDMIDMKTPGAISESSTIDHTFDRDDKTKVAKKYGLTDVGRDDRVERSEKELAEMQRKDAAKKAKKALDEKKKRRNKQLKKARNAKKRKAFINKVKSKLPGVKQEDASAVDNPDIDWTVERDKRNIFDSHQDMEPYIPESYQFQLKEHIQFFDKLDEAAQKKQKYSPVYVIIMHTGTPLATIIKSAIGSEYSHASISFDSSLTNMYSFARKLSDTGKASHDGGFRKENIANPFFKDREVKYSMYMVPCTEDQIRLMQKRLDYFQKNQNNFTYDFTGLVKSYFHISDNPEYRWFCTRFVADILNAGRPTDPYIADPFLVRPDDFMETNFAMYVTSGYLDKYDQKEVDKITKRLLNQKKVQKFIQDSQNEMALDLPLDNPYERFVLNYQLSQMNESAVDQFLMYLKSFKVRFDANGDIRITRREYDQLDGHFRSSLKMIKACEEAGNVEGVKEELYKIHYMIELINTYYLKPYAKNYRPNTKEIRKDMMDLRSVMMNAFKQNLEWVTMKDPSYNFQRGYQVSTYGSETKIPHKVITHVGQAITTMLA